MEQIPTGSATGFKNLGTSLTRIGIDSKISRPDQIGIWDWFHKLELVIRSCSGAQEVES